MAGRTYSSTLWDKQTTRPDQTIGDGRLAELRKIGGGSRAACHECRVYCCSSMSIKLLASPSPLIRQCFETHGRLLKDHSDQTDALVAESINMLRQCCTTATPEYRRLLGRVDNHCNIRRAIILSTHARVRHPKVMHAINMLEHPSLLPWLVWKPLRPFVWPMHR